MKHTQIKTGAYRALFQDALTLYRTQADAAELPVIDHYLKLLADPSYKFGVPQSGVSQYAPGELFFRS